jgi:hypothetical protein
MMQASIGYTESSERGKMSKGYSIWMAGASKERIRSQ